MDVTFTNVLEGARQYFQGLPAATGSAASPSSSTVSYGSAVACSYTAASGGEPAAPVNSTAASTAGTATVNSSQAATPQHSQAGNESSVQYWSEPVAAQPQHVPDPQDRVKDTTNVQTHENVMHPQQYQHQQPSHTHQPTNPPPSRTQTLDASKVQQSIHSYHYPQSQVPASQSYQFSRPQSHEAASSVLQYSSHYSQTTHRPLNVQAGSHHQRHPSQSPSAQQHLPQSQVRPPSRSHEQMTPSPKTQSYHQLQPPRHHTPASHAQSMYMNNYQQAKPYYPAHSQSQTSLPPSSSHSYPQPASSQAYMPNHQFTPHSYSPHSHSPVQTQTQYLSTKPTVQHSSYDSSNGGKSEMQTGAAGHLPASQHHRATHNLPPIAALSSVNYHSNKSNREAVQRLANHRQRTQAMSHAPGTSTPATLNSTVTVPSTVSASTSQQQAPRVPAQYPQHSNNQYNSNNYIQTSVGGPSSVQHSSSTNGPTYPYPPTSTQAYTCTTTSSTSSLSTTSSTASIYNQSSYPQHFQKVTKTSYQQESSNQKQPQYQSSSSKDYSYQAASSSNRMNLEQAPANNLSQHARNESNLATTMTAKHKRESPLDLSVKTVRTSADSTAHDDSEVHSSDSQRSNKTYASNRSMPPPMQVPANAHYPPYDHHATNHQRNSNIRSTPVSTGSGAPKVDFLPNFNVSSLHHAQRNHTTESNRQVVHPSHSDKNHNVNRAPDVNNQNKYSRNVAYNSKVYYPQHTSYHPSTSYQHAYNNNVMPNTGHPNAYGTAQIPTKRVTEGLPRIDFPTPGQSNKSAAMYSNNVRDVSRKRPAETVPAVPSKVPKMDGWREAIDQQIEQRLSSYANSRKQEQQQLPQQQPSHQQQLPPQQPHHHMQTHTPTHTQHQKPSSNIAAKSMVNGNVPSHHGPRDMYQSPYPQMHPAYPQVQQPFNNNNQYHSQPTSHSQTYVPTAMTQHHYPPHANVPNHSQQHDMYQPNALARANSNPKLATSPVRNNNFGGADKRTLSILRNSLEIKGAKEAQKKLEQVQMKPQEINVNHMRSSGVQQPTTDVSAPLQPKPGIVGRHNVSPFPAANLLERNSNTPPIYKFHFPRAVDSVRFETESITKDNMGQTTTDKQDTYPPNEAFAQNNSSSVPTDANSGTTDLDGLAAFLAARIRTKAERKQVSTNQGQIQNVTSNSTYGQPENASEPVSDKNIHAMVPQGSANNVTTTTITTTTTGSPPKLTKERGVLPPRRRLFSRSEDEPIIAATAPSSSTSNLCLPSRDSVLRSSSETSVFDFRDSDSEGEMPVLERQSLDDMRRDRKSLVKTQQPTTLETDVIKTEGKEIVEEDESSDPFWADTCDKFLEQLKTSGGKKRGRRKKVVEPDVLAKLETVTKEKPLENITLEAVVKLENIAFLENKVIISPEEIKTEEEVKSPKVEEDSDSDVPLIRRKNITVKKEDTLSDGEDSNLETKKEKIGAKIKIEYSSDSSVSDSETIQSVSDKLRNRKSRENKENNKQNENDKGMVLRSADSSPSKKSSTVTKKKAIFGDGSDFHPGWEEEVYKYKRSLRMPARLINITRAPHWHRVSTSLPDLDPCSPAPSSLTDDTEFSIIQRRSVPSSFTETASAGKLKRDVLDSDMDSNSSFTFSIQKGLYDSEASSSSIKLTSMKKSEDRLKNKENNNSILDVLVERCSRYKRKKVKGKDQKIGPKLIPKSTDPLELLPTPSLGIGSPEKESNKVGRGKTKNIKEDKIEMTDSVYLGFFRKQTVNTFRDTFKKNSGFMGMGEQFSTVVLNTRTRTETRVMKQRATIREVFGEERPASAPPIACREDDNMDSSQDSVASDKKVDNKPEVQITHKTRNKENNLSPTRTGLRSASGRRNKNLLTKKLQRGRKRTNNFLKVLASKKIRSEMPEEQNVIKSETPSIKSETPSIDGEEGSEVSVVIPTKKRLKLRNMRRKFSSGFDYIRKKKKQVKKEIVDADGTVKPKRRGIIPRPSPESVQDIQREIKTWVMNKGVGETHLHRAARLGYTDITAYCLEKLDSIPSPKDNAGYTPLHEACSRGHLDIARLLLQYGANVSESAQGGIRPLHEAAENGFVEIIRLLLSYGADPMLATYSGLTPLSLATDEETKSLLKQYMADVQGLPAPPWSFNGPAACFDPYDSGYDPLDCAPSPEPVPEDEDIEIEMSEQQLPNLYTLRGEPPNERWVLLQDLSMILKIKSRDTLLRQINGNTASTSSSAANSHKNVLRELKFADFMEQARCCQLLCANEKLNARSSKIALVKYTDKVKQLLGVERVVVTTR